MRAATRSTPNDSRATRAAITLELSPLLTAANAPASRIPAASRTVWSKPMPVIFLPLKEERNFRNASGFWSITATEWPRSSRMWASVEPTRPHPMITMCTAASSQSAARHGNPPAARTSRQAGILAPVEVLDLDVSRVANGGWCVARDGGGRVVFVRHALPGERVRARVTEATASFARAEAVEVLRASPDRVTPRCPHAHPGGCGGCDWQHADLAAQRRLKAEVVREQLRRLAGLDREVTVEPVAGDDDGLGWRTRVRFSVGPGGTAGLLAHRSHDVVEVGDCPIAHPLVRARAVTARN